MTLVWDNFTRGGSEKLAMLALADWCNDQGGSLHPSISGIAKKINVSESQARRIIHGLIDEGYLTVIANHEGGKAARLLDESNITSRFANCDFDNYVVENGEKQEKVFRLCKSYADGFEQNHKTGSCLLLCGNPGTGKNHLATAICKQVMQS